MKKIIVMLIAVTMTFGAMAQSKTTSSSSSSKATTSTASQSKSSGYTTITIQGPITITAGDDPTVSQSEWLGPMLGEVPVDLTARFTDTAMSADIDIQMPGMAIGVSIFGVAPMLKGDVNNDNVVNISDINTIVGIILGN